MEALALFSRLETARFWLQQLVPPIQIIFGTFGNIFNIILFTRRTLRSNPCGLYFLGSSINNFIYVYTIILVGYLEQSSYYSLQTSNVVLCKIRSIVLYMPFCLVLWFPVLASIDRFLSSSRNVRLRQWSTVPIARKIIIGLPLFFLVIHLHMPVFYQPICFGDLCVCDVASSEYLIFFSIFGSLIGCILPVLSMFIFAILTIRNVRSVQNRVAPQVNNGRGENTRPNEQQLTKMLLFQVLVTLLLSVPYIIITLYGVVYFVLLRNTPSPVEELIFFFVKYLLSLLYSTNAIAGFYIYTLTGPKFRSEAKQCVYGGLKFVLTGTGVIRCLPLSVRQTMENMRNTTQIHETTMRSQRKS